MGIFRHSYEYFLYSFLTLPTHQEKLSINQNNIATHSFQRRFTIRKHQIHYETNQNNYPQ
jgi:hypothetical protein